MNINISQILNFNLNGYFYVYVVFCYLMDLESIKTNSLLFLCLLNDSYLEIKIIIEKKTILNISIIYKYKIKLK